MGCSKMSSYIAQIKFPKSVQLKGKHRVRTWLKFYCQKSGRFTFSVYRVSRCIQCKITLCLSWGGVEVVPESEIKNTINKVEYTIKAALQRIWGFHIFVHNILKLSSSWKFSNVGLLKTNKQKNKNKKQKTKTEKFKFRNWQNVMSYPLPVVFYQRSSSIKSLNRLSNCCRHERDSDVNMISYDRTLNCFRPICEIYPFCKLRTFEKYFCCCSLEKNPFLMRFDPFLPILKYR